MSAPSPAAAGGAARRREDAILSAALRLAAAQGWRAATVAGIAADAGIAKGAVYKHFASKEDIYARLAADVLRGLLARLRLRESAAPPAQRLRTALATVFDELEAAAEARDILFAMQTRDVQASLGSQARDRLAAAELAIDAVVQEHLAAGMADGSFRAQPLEAAAFAVRAAVFGAAQQAWRLGLPPDQATRRAVIELAVRGLGGPGAS